MGPRSWKSVKVDERLVVHHLCLWKKYFGIEKGGMHKVNAVDKKKNKPEAESGMRANMQRDAILGHYDGDLFVPSVMFLVLILLVEPGRKENRRRMTVVCSTVHYLRASVLVAILLLLPFLA